VFRRYVISAIFRRNVASYFSGVLGYLFIIAFVIVGGLLAFRQQFFTNNVANLDQLSDGIPMLLLFLVPAITMSAWADEKKLGTDELLFTLPATDLEVLIAKYLAVLAVYSIALAFSLTHLLVLSVIGSPDLGVAFTTYFGYWLAGAALLAAGMFGSVLTSSTTVAFVLGVIMCAVPVFIGSIAPSNDFLRNLSVREQLHDFELGIIPLSGIFYFASLTVFMLYLNLVMIRRRHWSTGQQTSMELQYVVRAVCLCLALISVDYIASHASGARADLTHEQVYTLSTTTKEVLKKINPDHPVKIEAYVSTDVPRDYAPVRKQLTGLLRQYAQLGGSSVDVHFIDVEPFSKEAEAAKIQGVLPERVRSEREGRRYEDTIYMGAVISSSYDQVVIPSFGPTTPVEYELTRSVRTVANQKRYTVGVMRTDADVIGGSHEWQIVTELKKQYNVKDVSPDSPLEDGKYDVLMVVMPSSLTQPQMNNLVQYVKKGHPTLLFDDPLPYAFNSPSGFGVTQAPRLPKPAPGSQFGMMGQMRQPAPPKADDGKATSLLDALNLAWDNGRAVWDAFNPHPEFATVMPEFIFISPKSGTRGAFDPSSEITSGLQEMLAAFAGEIRPMRNSDSVKFEPLLRTSPHSGYLEWEEYTEQGLDFSHGFTPTARLREDRPHLLDPRGGALVLAAHITADTPENPYKLNVVFVTDIDLISDWFFYNRSHGSDSNLDFDNVTFVLNAVDVLAGDKTFLDLRKRRPELRTLTGVEKRTAKFVQDRIDKTKEADDEAKKLVQKAQHQFDDKRVAIEKDPKLSPPEKEELIHRLKEGEERRFDVAKVEIDRGKQQEIDEIKNATERRIRETEHQVMAIAVLVPPIPAIVLGLVVLIMRWLREQRYIAPERRVEQDRPKK
jgi:ABC-2 type transport system permease protein